MQKFPRDIGWHNWGSLMCNTELFAPLVRAVLERHGLTVMPIEAGFPGTHAVFQSGDYVVKLYAPLGLPDEYAERRAYLAANGLPLIPRLYGEGVIDAGGYKWPYIIIERVQGNAVREVWGSMNATQRLNAARALAKWSLAYHSIPDPFDAGSDISTLDFIENRVAVVEKSASELSGYDDFCCKAIDNMPGLFTRETPMLIHADLTEDHLLVNGGKYAVIDLADSRVGFEQMDWICVWFGLMASDRDSFIAYLKACGREWNERALVDMQTCTLLHGYGVSILINTMKKTGIKDIEQLYPNI